MGLYCKYLELIFVAITVGNYGLASWKINHIAMPRDGTSTIYS